ncbi:MAG TPA: hypothetical protein VNZ53_04160 [Steroidobacteraceae bacterium]|jgi:hypothetical protein|nr:hypothetical protein [Steroidobacteraceae bacterium]
MKSMRNPAHRHPTEKAHGIASVGTANKGRASHNLGKRVTREALRGFVNPGSRNATTRAMLYQSGQYGPGK